METGKLYQVNFTSGIQWYHTGGLKLCDFQGNDSGIVMYLQTIPAFSGEYNQFVHLDSGCLIEFIEHSGEHNVVCPLK